MESFLRKRFGDKKFFSEEYPVFNPHVTLAEKFSRKNLSLIRPAFPCELVFDSFSWDHQGKFI